MRKNDFLIIMAGGIGSRFWPMSRNAYPKQFHDVLGLGKSLLQMTFERFSGFIPPENIFVVTHERYEHLVREQLPAISPAQILAEPIGRNTAPCIAYGTARIRKINPDAGIVVAASDHLILNNDRFLRDISTGLDACHAREVIVTLGIPPTRPDTGYGYIQVRDEEEMPRLHKVRLFTEKPGLEMAQTFLRSGDFVWNSGIFIFSARTIDHALHHYMPDMHELFDGIMPKLGTPAEKEAIALTYSRCKNDSIDTGVMEKAGNVFVIRASFDWSDLGTWGSLYEQMEKDYVGNAVNGRVIAYNAANNMVHSDNPAKLVVLDNLDDFIVVDTADVLLICPRSNEQHIKEIVNDVRRDTGEKFV